MPVACWPHCCTGDLAVFVHGKRHSFPEFFPRFHSIHFSSGVICLGSYNYLGAATDPWSRTCSLATYDFSVPATNLKRLPPSPPRFCVSIVLNSPVSTRCPATMLSLLSSQAEPGYGRLAALLAMAGLSESVLMLKFWTSHLLSYQNENPRRVEWLLIQRRNGSLSGDMTPQIPRG
jgi:hypothetical protein